MSFGHPRRAAAAHLRRDDQRGAAGDPDVHLHGRDAGAIARRRGSARDAWAGCSARCAAGSAFRSSIVGALLAAAKGVVGATTVTMGLIVLPAMLRHGYDPRLAAGTVAATATLAQIFPPVDRAGAARRPAQQRLSGGATGAGQVRARRRCRSATCSPARCVPGLLLVGALSLSRLHRAVAGAAPAIPPDPRRAEAAALRAALVEVLVAPLAAHPRGARLDPRRHRDADRSGLGRRGRRDPARRAQGRARRAAGAGGARRPRRSPA